MAVSQLLKISVHCTTVGIALKLVIGLYPDTAYYYFTCISNFILYVTLSAVTYSFCKHLYNREKVETDKKAVLITGCDSGFGHRLAQKLDSIGFQVFASCLFPEGEGAKMLKQNGSERLHVLHMDVTKDETVEKALQFVKNNLGSNILWAVVNNAGISKGFSVDFSSIDDVKDTIDVNTLGAVRVTKSFLPLLKKSKGRIVNVTSLVARILCTDMCAYVMSKRATSSFTEVLSLELKVWGVRAISIEPETFRTPITDPEGLIKRLEVEAKKIPADIISSYGKEYLRKFKKAVMKFFSLGCTDIDIVVDDIVTAITQKCPNHVYKPRRSIVARILIFMLEILPFGLYEDISLFVMKILDYPVPEDIINSKMHNL